MKGCRLARREGGFTLVELLVVILVLAILVGIAIPVFLTQRNKARVAAAQRSLKDAALAAEAYGVDNGGNYSGLDGADGLTHLRNNGFNPTVNVNIDVFGETDRYCLLAQSILLDDEHEWYYGTYEPANGAPIPGDDYTCGDDPDLPIDLPDLPPCAPPLLVPPLCED